MGTALHLPWPSLMRACGPAQVVLAHPPASLQPSSQRASRQRTYPRCRIERTIAKVRSIARNLLDFFAFIIDPSHFKFSFAEIPPGREIARQGRAASFGYERTGSLITASKNTPQSPFLSQIRRVSFLTRGSIATAISAGSSFSFTPQIGTGSFAPARRDVDQVLRPLAGSSHRLLPRNRYHLPMWLFSCRPRIGHMRRAKARWI